MFTKTFSAKLLAKKTAAAGAPFLKGLFNEIIKWLIDRFRAKMIKQNTDRKFSEGLTGMHTGEYI